MEEKVKKGAVELTDLAIGIVVLGIAVSVGATILTNLRDSRLSSVNTYTVANESIQLNDTGVQLANVDPYASGVDLLVNGSTVTSGNYTVSTNDFGTGTLSLTSNEYNLSLANFSYNIRNVTDPQYSLPNDAALGLGEYGNWFTIIAIVGIAGLVIALVMMSLGNRGSGSVSY